MCIKKKDCFVLYFLFFMISIFLFSSCGLENHESIALGNDQNLVHSADEALKSDNFEKSIRLHKILLKKSPHNCDEIYHLGYSYGQVGNHQKEAYYYQKAVDNGFRKKNIFFNLAMVYLDLNEIEKSLETLRQGLKYEPNNADIYFGLGLVYNKVGKIAISKKKYIKALLIEPGHIDAKLNLAILYLDEHECKKAKNQLKDLLKIEPENDEALSLSQQFKNYNCKNYK